MIQKGMDQFTKAFSAIGAVLLVLITIMIVVNIVLRSFFHVQIKGNLEVVQYGVMLCAGLAMCRTTFTDHQIRVTMLVDSLPRVIRQGLAALGNLIGAGMFVLVGGCLFTYIAKAVANKQITEVLHIPLPYVYALMGCCFFACAAVFFYRCCHSVISLFQQPEPTLKEENCVKPPEG